MSTVIYKMPAFGPFGSNAVADEMAITIQIDGISQGDADSLAEALSGEPGRITLSGDIKDVSMADKTVAIEIGGDVKMKVNPPTDSVEADLLS